MLFALASYALAVTFARAGYLGYAGAMSVLGIAASIRLARQRAWKPGRVAIAIALPLAGMAVIIPIMTSSFMQSRIATTQADANVRMHHWTEAIDMMDSGVTTALFGMGLGSFPRTYPLKAPRNEVPATFSYQREGDNGFVRLGSGRMLYLGQRVSVEAGQSYTLSLDMRSESARRLVAAPAARKEQFVLVSLQVADFRGKKPSANWQHHEVKFNSEAVGSGSWLVRRPVALSLHNPGTVTPLSTWITFIF